MPPRKDDRSKGLHPEEVRQRSIRESAQKALKDLRTSVGVIDKRDAYIGVFEPQLQHVTFATFLDNDLNSNVDFYFAEWLHVEFQARQLSRLIEQYRTIAVPGETESTKREREEDIATLTPLVETYGSISPTPDAQAEGKPSLLEISEMKITSVGSKLRISTEDMARIDSVFQSTPEPDDIALGLFLIHAGGVAQKLGESAVRIQFIKAGLSQDQIAIWQRLGQVMQAYVKTRYDQAMYRIWPEHLAKNFTTLPEVREGNFPDNAEIMSLYVAYTYAHGLKIMPSSFSDLLAKGFIPGLPEDSIADILQYYEQRFWTGLAVSADFKAMYAHAEASMGTPEQEQLVEDVLAALADKPANAQVTKAFVSSFGSIRAALGKSIVQIGNYGNAAVYLANHQNNSLDFFIVDQEKGVSYALEIDADALDIGTINIPAYKPLVEDLMDKALGFLTERRAAKAALKPAAIPPLPKRVYDTSPSTRNGAAERRELTKRRHIRADAGLPADLRKAYKQLDGEALSEASSPVVSVERPPKFESDYAALPTDKLRERVDELLVMIAVGDKRIKPLVGSHRDYGEMVSRVWVGSSYRMTFIKRDNEIILLDISLKPKAYDVVTIRSRITEALDWLDRKKAQN